MRRIRFDVVALAPVCFLLACDSSVSPKSAIRPTPPGVSLTPRVNSLRFPSDSVDVSIGHSAHLSFDALTVAGAAVNTSLLRNVEWKSANPDVAKVDSTGTLTAASMGSAVVSVIADGIADSVVVSVVSRSVASVRVNVASALSLTVGSQFQARAAAFDGGGGILFSRVFSWSTSDQSVVDVSSSGLLTAKNVGTATITATSEDESASFTVDVVPGPTGTIDLTLGTSTLQVGQSTQATIADVTGGLASLTGHTIAWSSSNPAAAAVSSSGVITGVAPGTAIIRAATDGFTGQASVTVTPAAAVDPISSVQPVTLPQLLTTSMASTPSNGRTLRVASGGNLQQALDTAIAGDRILLAAGATFVGNFHLGWKDGGGSGNWITVQSDGGLPSEGQRMTPSLAGALSAPKLVSNSVLPTVIADPGAAGWRIIGLEITTDQTAPFGNSLVELGGANVKTLAMIPKNVILDRLYVHGAPSFDVRRCITLNSDSTAIIDSYISDCHYREVDSQAIWGWNGNGPYKIVNNYLEASTEVVGFGGADPSFPNLVPSDIEIRGNHITRPMSWKNGPWLEKNLVEFKTGRRVLIDGNVVENSWLAAQWGWAFVLWSVNQDGGCPWCGTSDVLITRNLIRNVAAGFQLTDKFSNPSVPMQRVAIRDNVVIGIANPAVGNGGYGFLIQGAIPSLTIEHNTLMNPAATSWMWPAGAGPFSNQVIRDNVTGGCNQGQYVVSIQMAFASLTTDASAFSNNVVACYDDYLHRFSTSNFFPTSLDAIGFAGGAGAAYSVTASPASLGLASSSPFKGKATDGTDPGANMDRITAAVANVIVP